ncbi:3-hydroxybutyryl-CoA dehydrogenase [Frankia sp. R43]|nr:3-hydroxybutyryl-CoA dehydrogenase [Frankia sp. R43]
MSDIHLVGVVGAGRMGAGIAEVCVRSDLEVLVCEETGQAAEAGRRRILASMERAVHRGRLSRRERDRAAWRLRFTTDLGDMADRQLVIEAVSENELLKREVFAALDKVVVDPAAILASTTSTIPIMKLGTATSRASHVLGLHFLNPAPVMPLVEVAPSLLTSALVRDRVESFATRVLGKRVVRSTDRVGFVVNSLLVPYLLAAVRMVESGITDAQDVDAAMTLGCAHPLGPLALADLIGLDILAAMAESMYTELRDPQYAPPPLLLRMVDAGLLGRKSGRGFHPYPGSTDYDYAEEGLSA